MLRVYIVSTDIIKISKTPAQEKCTATRILIFIRVYWFGYYRIEAPQKRNASSGTVTAFETVLLKIQCSSGH